MTVSRKWTDALSVKIIDNLSEINGVNGYLQHGDLELLTHFAKQMPVNAKIAEIGSFLGLSGLIMAWTLYTSGKFGARIYCVDTWEGSMEHQSMEMIQKGNFFDLYKRNISESGLATYFVPIRKDSVDASRDFPDRSFDLIFIDGDHGFDGCLADLKA
ncbi:MAG: class I SAM-dependent methyltransferase [Syntrophobacteraceae bacterium]